MSEIEEAGDFDRLVESCRRGETPPPDADRELAALAAVLARLDFSGESPTRESLRRKLVARAERAASRRAPLRAFSLAAGAAVSAVALALLIARPGEAPLPAAPAAGPGLNRILVLAPVIKGRTIAPEAVRGAQKRAGVALGREALYDALHGSEVVVVSEGKVLRNAKGSTIRWDIEGRTFVLESRRVALSDIFTTPGNKDDRRL